MPSNFMMIFLMILSFIVLNVGLWLRFLIFKTWSNRLKQILVIITNGGLIIAWVYAMVSHSW